MTTTKRLTSVVLLLALVLAGVLVLRPTGATLAAWSDEVTVAVPTLRTGGVSMDVTSATGTTATVAMGGDVAGTWRPTTVRVSVDGRALTGAELSGSRVEYRVAAAGATCPTTAPTFSAAPSGPATTFPVTGGAPLSGARTMCLSVVPSDQTRIALAGRTLSVATTIDGVTVAPTTWTTTGSWAADHRMPAGPSVTGPSCSRGFLNQVVTLGWSWDRAGLGQDVSRWSVQVEDRGSWREVKSVAARSTSTTISPYESNFIQFETYTMRVAAVLPDGTTIPSTTTTDVRIERIGLGAAYCA